MITASRPRISDLIVFDGHMTSWTGSSQPTLKHIGVVIEAAADLRLFRVYTGGVC